MAAVRRMGAVTWKISEYRITAGARESAAGRNTYVRIGPVGVETSATSSLIVMFRLRRQVNLTGIIALAPLLRMPPAPSRQTDFSSYTGPRRPADIPRFRPAASYRGCGSNHGLDARLE